MVWCVGKTSVLNRVITVMRAIKRESSSHVINALGTQKLRDPLSVSLSNLYRNFRQYKI